MILPVVIFHNNNIKKSIYKFLLIGSQDTITYQDLNIRYNNNSYREMTDAKPKRRTIQERVEAIFQFIEEQKDVFPKSRLKEIGINPKAAEKWLKLIDYIQYQPKIRLIQTEHNTLVEKVEGKYQALMRKMIMDQTL
ncbi:unnamed protein product, partial [marine sediment metagenome]